MNRKEAERATHINHLMNAIYDDVDNLSESLFDREKDECLLAINNLTEKLNDIKESIDHELK